MGDDAELPTCLDALCALERAVEKEWWWLAGALHAVAEVSAEVPQTSVGCLASCRLRSSIWIASASRSPAGRGNSRSHGGGIEATHPIGTYRVSRRLRKA